MYIQLSNTIRIEKGPVRKFGKATPELLDNKVTASHYFVGGKDAYGEDIVFGQRFCYLDWKGDWVWYIYRWEDGRYRPVDVQPTEDAAREAALEFAT